ncbi:MAG: DUF167 family protein [Candidatus Micrarchaeota archaeon]
MLKETGSGLLIDVEIQPNSKKFEIGEVDSWINRLKIRVSSSPLKNRANKELVKEMEKKLGCKVSIARGEKSTKKTLLIKGDGKKVRKVLNL